MIHNHMRFRSFVWILLMVLGYQLSVALTLHRTRNISDSVLRQRWQVKPLVLVFALIGGVFITGWLAGYANTIFSHEWVTAHLSSKVSSTALRML